MAVFSIQTPGAIFLAVRNDVAKEVTWRVAGISCTLSFGFLVSLACGLT